MKRSFLLSVELLEDRCVPAVVVQPATVLPEPVPVPAKTFVIDPILIDPNVPAVAPPNSPDITIPPILILPIANPIWP